MTAEVFYDWANQPEFDDRFFELDRCVAVELPYPGINYTERFVH